MRDTYIFSQILKYYLYALYEEINVLYEEATHYFKLSTKESKAKLKTEIERYLDLVRIEKKILRYIKKDFDYIKLNDIERFLDIIDTNYEYRYIKLDNVLASFEENPNYKNGFSFREIDSKQVYTDYLNYVNGFNKDNIKEFMVGEKIFDEKQYDRVVRDAKILSIDASGNENIFGLSSNNDLVVPKICDEYSSLLWVYCLTRKSLTLRDDVSSSIIDSDDLPIFYKLLFKEKNGHIKVEIPATKKATFLLHNYYNEPFDEQIKRLKKL